MLNERPEKSTEKICDIDGTPCEGQGTMDECASCIPMPDKLGAELDQMEMNISLWKETRVVLTDAMESFAIGEQNLTELLEVLRYGTAAWARVKKALSLVTRLSRDMPYLERHINRELYYLKKLPKQERKK